jgi:twitching motility two-component system response regulator PilG
MLSSKDGVFDKARGRMAGAQDYLTKPFSKEQLLQAVQQFGSVVPGVA